MRNAPVRARRRALGSPRQRRLGLLLLVVAIGFGTLLPIQADAGYIQGPPTLTGGGHDYGAAVMRDGSVDRYWWCGVDTSSGSLEEVIWYKDSGSTPNRVAVIKPRNAPFWDQHLICDPSVVKGMFSYNNMAFAYAIYYTSNLHVNGNGNAVDNAVGVAFTNNPADPNSYVRHLIPVLYPVNQNAGNYGAGQQVAMRISGTAAGVRMLFRDESTGPYIGYTATSTNGWQFGPWTTLSRDGLPSDTLNGSGDFGLDAAGTTYYGVLPTLSTDNAMPLRRDPLPNTDPTKGDGERYRATMWKIPKAAFESGTGTFEYIGEINSDFTQSHLFHNTALVRDPNGTIPTLPSLTVWAGGLPGSAANPLALFNRDFEINDVFWVHYTPDQRIRIRRYVNDGSGQHYTSATINPLYGSHVEASLDRWLADKGGSQKVPLYSCMLYGSYDFFLSTDRRCENTSATEATKVKSMPLGRIGWVSTVDLGAATDPLYMCLAAGNERFMTVSSTCEGAGSPVGGAPLGYVWNTAS